MNILQIGNLDGGSPHSTERHLMATLKSMGHTVVPVHERGWNPESTSLDGIDVMLWTNTRSWLPTPEHVRAFLARCDERNIPTVGIHLDLWRGLDRVKDLDTNPWFRMRYVFTADGGDETLWTSRGIRHHWLPPAVLESACYLAEPDRNRFPHDVIFVGSGGPYHREYPFRTILTEWLPQKYAGRYMHYPGGVRGHDLNVLYASAKVIVGDSCFAGTAPRYWSDRLPETLGRGGRLVFPAIEGMPADVPCRLFVPGNLEELAAAVEDALSVDGSDERKRAIEWTRAGHTYRHRLEEVFTKLRADGAIA